MSDLSCPEIKLMGAIIQQAIVDLKDKDANFWLTRRQASQFIFSDELDDFLLYFHFNPGQADYIRALAKRFMSSNRTIYQIGRKEYVRSSVRRVEEEGEDIGGNEGFKPINGKRMGRPTNTCQIKRILRSSV